jgi:glucokinase
VHLGGSESLIVYATEYLPGWMHTPIDKELTASSKLVSLVENDPNTLAVAAKILGAARSCSNSFCLSLGNDVGSGCYGNGQLTRGQHFCGNALGHIPIARDGIPCNCGQSGCLEVYANAKALVRNAGRTGSGPRRG